MAAWRAVVNMSTLGSIGSWKLHLNLYVFLADRHYVYRTLGDTDFQSSNFTAGGSFMLKARPWAAAVFAIR